MFIHLINGASSGDYYFQDQFQVRYFLICIEYVRTDQNMSFGYRETYSVKLMNGNLGSREDICTKTVS